MLRRILARPNEFTEDTSEVRRIFAHICISHDVFQNLVSFLNGLVISFAKIEGDTKGYYQRYVKIQSTLLHLRRLQEEYGRCLDKISGEITGNRGPWQVKLPEPAKIKQLVSDAFIDLQAGILSFPILRSYLEINLSIFLENTMDHMLRNMKLSEYQDKKIVFQRPMEFNDLIRLADLFKILNNRDKDIICRFYDNASKSIHTGSFFDQLVAWHLLFYLDNLPLQSGSYFESFLKELNDLIEKGKIKIVSIDDNLTDYSRFQTTSNDRTTS